MILSQYRCQVVKWPIDLPMTFSKLIGRDIEVAVGPLQVCAGHEGGCEAAVHSMRQIFQDPATEAILLINATNFADFWYLSRGRSHISHVRTLRSCCLTYLWSTGMRGQNVRPGDYSAQASPWAFPVLRASLPRKIKTRT